MAMAMAWACKELAALGRFIGDEAYASQLLESRRALTETINREAWDGEWYLRAFTKDGSIGAKSSPTGGNIYVNPQSWSILADVVPRERLEAVLKAIDGMDTRYGIPLCKPAYETFDRHVGRMSGMLPGLFENGGVYNHANAFKMMADCKVGRGNQAYETLKKMMPDSETNPSSVSGAEPYVFVNCWCMHPAFYTRIWFSWSTGTSGWALRGFYEGICGLRRDYAGLRVQPCLPDAWKEAEVWRTFRGCRYHVRIENTKTGKATVFVDGVQQASNLLPVFSDGKEHEVVVRT